MQALANRQILVGVTGGIAAYKSAELIRLLKTAGACVRVVMTEAAQQFITPLTLQALSGNPVHTQLLDPEAEAGMGHIELARWAELVLIAPASADFIARLALGQADDLLSTLCLATSAPIAVAPAMNQAMWNARATQRNLNILRADDVSIWGPASGEQACGEIGPGRMLEPQVLAQQCAECFTAPTLSGCRVVITAGPTREPLDPVRYLSNHSSGKMGYALAAAAAEAGARVTLISGPVNLVAPAGVERVGVTTASEMYEAAMQQARNSDIFIAAAAVADYTPATTADNKIKKHQGPLSLELQPTRDIVAAVAALAPKPYTVGFAAETRNVLNYARDKLKRKQLDMIVANDVSVEGIGFNSDDNAVTLIWEHTQHELPRAPKQQLSRQIIALIAQQYCPPQ